MTTENVIISAYQKVPTDSFTGEKTGGINYFVDIIIPMKGGKMHMQLPSTKDINEAIDTAIKIQEQQRPPLKAK